MKILYLASNGGADGSSVALYNLINGLYKKHEVHIVFPNTGFISNKLVKLGVQCHFISQYYLTKYPSLESIKAKIKFPLNLTKNLIANHLAYRKLLKLCSELKPDIIHTNVGPLDIGYKVAIKLKIKHVWHIREYQDLDFNIRFFPSKAKFINLIKSPDNHCIAITKDIFSYWNMTPVKDVIIYDGVLELKEHNLNPNKKKSFLFVGRIEDAKGIKTLLKAFTKFCQIDKNYCLMIAGRGQQHYVQECIQIVKSNNIENNVTFLGQRKDVYKLMDEALALIVPSRNEGFGFITAEAMFNHCLVIGRNTAGTKEQFDRGLEQSGIEIGLRFEDEAELLEALIQATKITKDKYKIITQQAYEISKNNYNIRKHINNINDLYSRIQLT